MSAIPGVIFSATADGHLRAYATRDGATLWDYDTAAAIATVYAGVTKGSTLDGGGPVIVNGILYTNQGMREL